MKIVLYCIKKKKRSRLMEFTRFPPAFGREVNITGLTDTWKVSVRRKKQGGALEAVWLNSLVMV